MVPLALPGPGLKGPCALGHQPWKFFPCHCSLALVRGAVSVRVTARFALPGQGSCLVALCVHPAAPGRVRLALPGSEP